jgi:hypothetical protein
MSEMDIVTFINNVNHCIFELEKYRPTEEWDLRFSRRRKCRSWSSVFWRRLAL